MIRRSSTDATGTPRWLLIGQVQHAQLAGALAEGWNLSDLPPAVQSELRWVAAHHDDGWLPWEASPSFDAEGRPRHFLEMPVEEINPIWATSIQRACDRSPLAGRLVAEHFLRLRAGSTTEQPPSASEFTRQYQRLSDDCWQLTREHLGADEKGEAIERAQRYLLLFDMLSLMLCCTPRSHATTFGLPSGEELVCEPLTPWRYRLAPWRIGQSTLRLNVDADEAPVRRYGSVNELKRSVRPLRLDWTLIP